MESNLLTVAWAQLWQVTLLVVVVALIVRAVARNRPHLAYALWLVVLVKCVTPPLLTSTSGVFCWLQPVEHIVTAEPPVPFEPATLTAPPNELVIPLYPVENVHAAPAESPIATETPRFQFSPTDLAFCGLIAWAIGATVALALSAWRWRACLCTACSFDGERNAELADQVQTLAQRLGLRRRVGVIVTQGRLGPAVTGILRPTLLVPEGMLAGKTPGEIEPILAHELMHIRRGDLWAGLLQTVVLALWWFHPLVRWAVRQAMREAEHEEIVDLLEQLRRMRVVHISLRAQAIEMSGESCPQFLGELSEETPSMVVAAAAAKQLLGQAGEGVREAPAVTLFNGQCVRIALGHSGEENPVVEQMAVQAVVSDDHRGVRLTAHTTRRLLHQASLQLASGDSAIFDFTEVVDAAQSGRRSFVLVTAEVVIAEEEEMRIGGRSKGNNTGWSAISSNRRSTFSRRESARVGEILW